MSSNQYVSRTRPPTKVPEVRTLLEQMKAAPREPIGTRIRLTRLTAADQAFVPLEKGDEGVVVGGNEASLWVRFDRGYDITIVPGIDQYVVVVEEEKAS
jgi:hypothetical protein